MGAKKTYEEKALLEERAKKKAKDLAVIVCRLSYDQTSVVFGELHRLYSKKENNRGINEEKYAAAMNKLFEAKRCIDEAWKNSKDHMEGCEGKHPRAIAGYVGMEDVVEDIYRNKSIRYETLKVFVCAAREEFMSQSVSDAKSVPPKPKLSGCLQQTAYSLDEMVDELS